MRMAFGRAALVAAAGLLFFGATVDRLIAAPAADDAAVETSAEPGKPLALTKSKTPRVHHASKARKPAKVAAAKPAKRTAPAKVAAQPAAKPSAISETVANANAQMPSTDAQGGAAAVDITPAPLEVAAADQLTELDKSLAAAPVEQPQQIAQLAQSVPPSSMLEVPASPEPVTQVRAASSTDAWAQSSLVGKIFIAFGGMLTLASAARMLVA